jgi:catechol 2,3-dioxygenase-like lactoylglutathione lyase family enzyme
VFAPESTSNAGADVPAHGAHGAGHVCFAISDEAFAEWRQRLLASGTDIEAELTWPRGGRSLYFRDPAGNSVELASPRIWGISERA